MRFSRLAISNFRQHKNIELDLSGPEADLIVIKGTMGAGKTNLLNAINWAIYGDIEDSNSTEVKLLSYSCLSEMDQGDYRDVEVHLTIDLDNNQTAFLSRKQSFKKTAENDSAAYDKSELVIQIFSEVSQGYEVEPNPEIWVEKHLPKRFRSYFLFDGEKLERFFKESDAPRIRAAIQEVAQIDVLDRLQSNLNIYASEVAKSAAKLTGTDGDKLASELTKLDELIEAARDRVKENEASEAKWRDKEISLDGELIKFGAAEANINRKMKLTSELEKFERDLSEAKVNLEQSLRNLAPTALAAAALRALSKEIEKAHEQDILPPPVRSSYLDELLEKGKCICGAHLGEGSTGRSTIQATIERYESVSVIGQALYEHQPQCISLLAKLGPEKLLVERDNNAIKTLIGNIETHENELKTLATELADVDDETQKKLAEERDEARSQAISAQSAKKAARAEEERLKLERIELLRKIQQADSTNSALAAAKKAARFSEVLAQKATDLYKSMNDQVRSAVATSLEDQFKAMTWKKDYFEEVTIDEEFLVHVTNNRGIQVLNDLSAGERLCLAFAFALTLSKEAGLNFPIIVDTPMGRLAPEVQANLAQVICESTLGTAETGNHQFGLLMTETEYNSRVAQVLSQRDPLVLAITFNQETAETTIQ